jgi:hypothetical protein
MITYLYHKRHKQTGLNYFGKTIKDPYVYLGSGTRWTAHLRKHGLDIETIKVWEFSNLEECSKFAVEFSTKNNIVESVDWANLRLENGLDGGYTPGAYTTEASLKKGAKLKGRIFTKETIDKMSSHTGKHLGEKNPMYGKKHGSATKKLQQEKALAREQKQCEYCGKECSPSNFARWHDKNCKHK